ncbi:MAG TPA: ABC transporter permease [Geminicoccaceae bacterium]|nr:ABC transporter permease [Geminicoccaceae bacterium]
MAVAGARPAAAAWPARGRTLAAARWLVLPALALVAWELASALGWLRPFSFPPPSRLASALVELTVHGFPQGQRIWVHVGMTLWRVVQGCLLAIALAIPLGVLIGSVRALDRLTLPIVTFARSVASLSLLPLAIIWFGTGELSKVLLIAYGCFWTMLPNAVAAVKYVDPLLVRAARTLDTGRAGVFLRVVLPAALPRMFAGARVAIGVGFMIIVGAEMIGTIQGLGALIMEARTFYRSDITIVGMALIGLIGFVVLGGLGWLERRLLPWQTGLEQVRR